MTLPGICTSLIYRVPVTRQWTEFWTVERKPSQNNMLSTCPWRYKLNTTHSLCGSYLAELHPVARENCLDLDQSNLVRRVHSMGRCQALRSRCDCNKIVGYTCVYPVDIPAGKRNSEGNSTDSGSGKNKTHIDSGKTEESYTTSKTKSENEHEEKEGGSVPTINPDKTDHDNNKEPEIIVVAPPYLQVNGQQGFVPPFLRRNNIQMGPPSYLQGLNLQQGVPPLLQPSQLSDRDAHVEHVNEE